MPLVLGLDRYNQASPAGLMRTNRHELLSYPLPGGGTLVYFVITPVTRLQIEVIVLPTARDAR
ncbi:MAG: hypothetical protein U0Z44_20425 [Kouleothrix sp.]